MYLYFLFLFLVCFSRNTLLLIIALMGFELARKSFHNPCLAFRPKSKILLSSDQRILFPMVRVLKVLFGKLQASCRVPFTEEWLPSGCSIIKAWLVECCRDGCSSRRFSYLHRGTQRSSVRVTIGFLVFGHLPDQGPSSPIAQFGWEASSRKSPNFCSRWFQTYSI